MKYQFGRINARALHLAVKAMEMSGEKAPLKRLDFISSNPNHDDHTWPHDRSYVVRFFPTGKRTMHFSATIEMQCKEHLDSVHQFERVEINITRKWEEGTNYDAWTFQTEDDDTLVLVEQGARDPDE